MSNETELHMGWNIEFELDETRIGEIFSHHSLSIFLTLTFIHQKTLPWQAPKSTFYRRGKWRRNWTRQKIEQKEIEDDQEEEENYEVR